MGLTFLKNRCILFLMKAYQYMEEFKAKFCDVDFKDELKVSTLLAYLEEVACLSADELGFGYDYLKPKGYAFMVSNIRCEFARPVRLGEKIRVRTWPLPPSHVVFGREYYLETLENEYLAGASSRWCLIDMNTGKLLRSQAIDNQDYTTYNTAKVLEDVKWKIPTFDVSGEAVRFSLKIANSEYDHNMHVNNTRYADYCMNCFSVEELSQRALKSFSISYVKQCKEGETLFFYRKKLENGEYLAQGVNENGEIVVQAQICFTNGERDDEN